MKLYLVQHGEAVPEELDPERSLSEKGISDVKKVAQFLRKRKIRVEKILHSAKLRAIQTAEILCKEAELSKKLEQCEGLAPNDPIVPMVEKIRTISSRENEMDLMIVGHLPYLQKLSDFLLTGSEAAGVLAFSQGGVVCLEEKPAADLARPGKWRILWQLIPELL